MHDRRGSGSMPWWRRHARMAMPVLAALPFLLAGCGDDPPPVVVEDPPTLERAEVTGTRLDPDFGNNGRFSVGLIAIDVDGAPISDTGVDVGIGVENPDVGTVEHRGTAFEAPSTLPSVSAVLLDDSASMDSNDPELLRAQAAQVYWETVLPDDPGNLVGLFDFGFGGHPTCDLVDTRVLVDFTRETGDLEAGLPTGTGPRGTPLYSSTDEVLTCLETGFVGEEHQRILLLLSDGEPNPPGSGDPTEDDIIAHATALDIPIYTVGLGPASESNCGGAVTSPAAVRVLRNLSVNTGGVYASACEAEALTPIFETIAIVASDGQLVASFGFTDPNLLPPSGTIISGTLSVAIGGGSDEVTFSFMIP